VATLATNAIEAVVASMAGSEEMRGWRSVVVDDVFTFIYFIMEVYKCCAFRAFCKDNAAINCICVQHKRNSILVNFDRSHAIARFHKSRIHF
jgi:hypothetical protein